MALFEELMEKTTSDFSYDNKNSMEAIRNNSKRLRSDKKKLELFGVEKLRACKVDSVKRREIVHQLEEKEIYSFEKYEC